MAIYRNVNEIVLPFNCLLHSSHLTYFGVLEMCHLSPVKLVPTPSGPLRLLLLLQSQDQTSPPPGSSLGSLHQVQTTVCLPSTQYILKLSVVSAFQGRKLVFIYTVVTPESRAGPALRTLSMFVHLSDYKFLELLCTLFKQFACYWVQKDASHVLAEQLE